MGGVIAYFKKRKIRGGGGVLSEIPSMVGVWIFSGTTHCSYRIFVTIDVKLVVILVIDLLIFTKLCILCTCLLQDYFHPGVVSHAQVLTINNFWKNIACNH